MINLTNHLSDRSNPHCPQSADNDGVPSSLSVMVTGDSCGGLLLWGLGSYFETPALSPYCPVTSFSSSPIINIIIPKGEYFWISDLSGCISCISVIFLPEEYPIVRLEKKKQLCVDTLGWCADIFWKYSSDKLSGKLRVFDRNRAISVEYLLEDEVKSVFKTEDYPENSPLYTDRRHSSYVTVCAVLPAWGLLFTGGFRSVVDVWDVRTGLRIHSVLTDTFSVTSLAVCMYTLSSPPSSSSLTLTDTVESEDSGMSSSAYLLVGQRSGEVYSYNLSLLAHSNRTGPVSHSRQSTGKVEITSDRLHISSYSPMPVTDILFSATGRVAAIVFARVCIVLHNCVSNRAMLELNFTAPLHYIADAIVSDFIENRMLQRVEKENIRVEKESKIVQKESKTVEKENRKVEKESRKVEKDNRKVEKESKTVQKDMVKATEKKGKGVTLVEAKAEIEAEVEEEVEVEVEEIDTFIVALHSTAGVRILDLFNYGEILATLNTDRGTPHTVAAVMFCTPLSPPQPLPLPLPLPIPPKHRSSSTSSSSSNSNSTQQQVSEEQSERFSVWGFHVSQGVHEECSPQFHSCVSNVLLPSGPSRCTRILLEEKGNGNGNGSGDEKGCGDGDGDVIRDEDESKSSNRNQSCKDTVIVGGDNEEGKEMENKNIEEDSLKLCSLDNTVLGMEVTYISPYLSVGVLWTFKRAIILSFSQTPTPGLEGQIGGQNVKIIREYRVPPGKIRLIYGNILDCCVTTSTPLSSPFLPSSDVVSEGHQDEMEIGDAKVDCPVDSCQLSVEVLLVHSDGTVMTAMVPLPPPLSLS